MNYSVDEGSYVKAQQLLEMINAHLLRHPLPEGTPAIRATLYSEPGQFFGGVIVGRLIDITNEVVLVATPTTADVDDHLERQTYLDTVTEFGTYCQTTLFDKHEQKILKFTMTVWGVTDELTELEVEILLDPQFWSHLPPSPGYCEE
jgi:hypothetical protein